MARRCLQLTMELLSDAIFSSGSSVPGGEDIALRLTVDGWPLLPGATLKGLLRESAGQLLCWSRAPDAETVLETLFGASGWHGTAAARRVLPGDLLPQDRTGAPEDLFALRTFTQVEDGVAKPGSLRTAACLKAGLVFTGLLLCDEQDEALLRQALRGIKWAGLLRSRGFGRVRLTVTCSEPLAPAAPVPPCEWLHYRLRLKTPLSVPHFRRSGVEGETLNDVATRRLLPGSAVRGLVGSALAEADPAWFAQNKNALLGDGTRFLDALPLAEDGSPVLPAPRGFYRDKAKTRFYSVLLTQEVVPGDKRAGLGAFCSIREDALHPYTPPIERSARIRRGADKQIFTVERIAAGTVLDGYIHLAQPELAPKISTAFPPLVAVGADRYAGSGLCEVVCVEPAAAPAWAQLGYAAADTVPDTVIMMLLTPMAMQCGGEACGLNLKALAARLGVQRVELAGCATALGQHTGYNRRWGCRMPEYPVYESGSVFKLRCTPAPTAAALAAVQAQGLGLARGEGYGQVLFLRSYDAFTLAPEVEADGFARSTPADRLRRARCRWLLAQKPVAGVSASQLGQLQALCEAGSVQDVRRFLAHNRQERGAAHGAQFEELSRRVERVFDSPLYETLAGTQRGESEPPELLRGDCPDTDAEKLRLLCDWLNLSRKEETP